VSLLALLLLFAFAAVGFIVARNVRRRAAANAADAACGKCGYCTRGISKLTCPECGSDLREVGILPPGVAGPLSFRARLICWTLLALLPGLALGGMLARSFAPYYLVLKQERVIALRRVSPPAVVIVTREGRVLDFGRSLHATAVPPRQMTLTYNRRAPAAMTVQLPDQRFVYTATGGGAVSGTLDAAAIAGWLTSEGFVDPNLAERAEEVATAIDEMNTAAAYKMYDINPPAGRVFPMRVYPTSEATSLTAATPAVIAGLFWLAGLPIVWLTGRQRRAAWRMQASSPH
jgi:hypothetical protein